MDDQEIDLGNLTDRELLLLVCNRLNGLCKQVAAMKRTQDEHVTLWAQAKVLAGLAFMIVSGAIGYLWSKVP